MLTESSITFMQAKPANGQRRKQRLHRRWRPHHAPVARLAGKADLFQRIDQRGHAKRRIVIHPHLPRRKVDARRCNAGHGLKPALHFRHAAGAVHAGHDQHGGFDNAVRSAGRVVTARRLHGATTWPSARTSRRSRQRPAGSGVVDTKRPPPSGAKTSASIGQAAQRVPGDGGDGRNALPREGRPASPPRDPLGAARQRGVPAQRLFALRSHRASG